MKSIIESLTSRIRKIRNNPDMAPTHLSLAIQEIVQSLEDIDNRLTALEAQHAKAEKVRNDWAIGAMVPIPQGHAVQIPDPLGLLSCTHPDCGRYEGPRSHECRGMANNACPRPSIGQGHTRKHDMAEAIATVHEECAKAAEGWETEVSGQKYQTSGNGDFWDAGNQYDQGRIDAAVSIRFLMGNKKSGDSIQGEQN